MLGIGTIGSSMAFHMGQLPVRWTAEEIAGMDYFYEKFNDQVTLEYWTDVWGYQFRTGLQADFRSAQPLWVKDTVQDLSHEGTSLAHVGTSFYVMRPGDLLPRHKDTYYRYCRHHAVPRDRIWRAIIFLQDWQPGFLFEIDDQPIAGYQNGTYVIWHNDAPHMAGNVGQVPRYTLQITGVVTESHEFPNTV